MWITFIQNLIHGKFYINCARSWTLQNCAVTNHLHFGGDTSIVQAKNFKFAVRGQWKRIGVVRTVNRGRWSWQRRFPSIDWRVNNSNTKNAFTLMNDVHPYKINVDVDIWRSTTLKEDTSSIRAVCLIDHFIANIVPWIETIWDIQRRKLLTSYNECQ